MDQHFYFFLCNSSPSWMVNMKFILTFICISEIIFGIPIAKSEEREITTIIQSFDNCKIIRLNLITLLDLF